MTTRNVPLLTVSQALGMSGPPIVVLLGGILGAELAPSPGWSTLPISLMILGVALAAIPSALLMQRIGRRRGFITGTLVAGVGSLLAAYAISQRSFPLLCIGALVIGMNGAFVQQYRFAAVESVAERYAGRAVSFVLLGGILAGILGPEVGRRTQGWLAVGQFTGSFVSLAVMYVAVAVLMLFLKDVVPRKEATSGEKRALKEIVAQPTYLVAVLAAAIAYGVMSFVMTATPVHMQRMAGFNLAQTSFVIQSHIVAMYLPSLFTGFLIDRLGILRVMLAGVLGLTASTLLGIGSQTLSQFWGSLVLLGIGWNFLFVGGTVLLTRSYRPPERFVAQATNDFTVFGIQAGASLSAGGVLFAANWGTLNLLTLPFLAVTLVAVLLLRRRIAPAPSGA